MNKRPTAFFVKYPFRIEDLIRPYLPKQRKPYKIEQVIELGKIDYENFITDLCVDRWFIEKYTQLCRIDSDGVWHCILVRQQVRTDGVLVMSEGEVFPKWAAYLPSKEGNR
jgi:hypothetical protein